MIFDRSVPKQPCMIKNISEGGACLHVGLLLDPPERFTLQVSSLGNLRRECKLVWPTAAGAVGGGGGDLLSYDMWP